MHTTSRWLVILTAVAFYLSSCASQKERPGEHFFRVSTVDGVVTALTSGIPKFEGQLFEFEEVLRLKQDENRPETLLNRALRYTLGDDGRFYVPDFGDNRIAVFDKDGEYSHSIGRQGEGPGEFQSIGMVRVHDGQLSAFDSRLQRTSLFSTEGIFIRQYSAPLGSSSVTAIFPESDDRLVIDYSQYDRTDRDWMPRWDTVAVLSASGDTLGLVEGEPWSMGKRVIVDRAIVFAQIFFGPRASVTYHKGRGIFRFCNEEPVLEWFDLSGVLQRTIRVDMTPESVTVAEKQGIQRLLQDQLAEADDDEWRRVMEEANKQAVIPDVKSYWVVVSVDDYGYHWVTRHTDFTAPDPYEEPDLYMLLSPEGEYLGEVRYPELRAWHSGGHILSYREDDETGEMHYIVYRMIPAVEGFEYPDLLTKAVLP